MIITSYDDILNIMKDIMVKEFRVSRENIKESSTFRELGIDSLDCVDLLCLFEKKVGKKINDDKYRKEFYKNCKGTIGEMANLFRLMLLEKEVQ